MSKKILITGGAGFIAHHVIDKILSTTDWEIITLDRLVSSKYWIFYLIFDDFYKFIR